MQEKSMLRSGIYLFLFVLLGMTGCNKFKGDQEVPAYIQIDSITISNSLGFTPTANITDAWVTVDGWGIGTYQLPIRHIPVLKKGKHEVLIQAGIRANNLSLRRCVYPFYSGIGFTVYFVEDSIINITRKEDGTMQTAVAIRTTNKYPLGNETFERGKHVFDTIPSFKSVPLEIKPCHTVSEKFPKISTPQHLYEEYVGFIHLEKSDSCCCLMSKEACTKGTDTELPYNQHIFIEIDYLTNNTFEVGIVSTLNNKPYTHPVVVVGENSKKDPHWSKIYVDISNAVTLQLSEGADNFKIFIRAILDEGNEEANIYLDNIRLVFTGKS